MTGVVTSDLEPTIRVVVQGPASQKHEVRALLDTGFKGFLTLTPALIAELGLTWVALAEGILADGSIELFQVFEVTVIWDGKLMVVQAESVESELLIGMELLKGHEVKLKVIAGGGITINPLTA